MEKNFRGSTKQFIVIRTVESLAFDRLLGWWSCVVYVL